MMCSRPSPALAAAALLAVPLLGACDSAPGAFEPQPLPQISNVEVTPTAVDFQSDAATASVPLVVRADVSAPAEVRVLVRYAESDEPLADVSQAVGPGRVEIAAPLQIPRGAIGDYEITLLTEGADGRAGDRAQAVLAFEASSLGAPSVSVVAPETVAPGGTLDVVAVVTDPDGVENVALVLLTDDTGAVVAQLFDEGGRADELAGDGRYGESLRLSADAQPGEIALRVVAFDRAGLEGEPAPFTVTVQ